MIGIGTLTTGIAAEVDVDGTVRQGQLRLGWRVRSGNEWLVPGRDGPVRQSRPGPAPVVHTAMRIPKGDAIARVYAVGAGDRNVVVVEVENDSPDAIAIGFVVDAPGVVAVDVNGVYVDGRQTLVPARRGGDVDDEHGLVFPVPHRTKVRVAIVSSAIVGAGIDVRGLADPDAVSRGWDRMLDRGLRVELPEPLRTDVDTARADLLLAPASAETFATLEAWGFDDDAIEMWGRLSMRARRAARRASPSAGPGLLAETLAALVSENGTVIDIVPGFRPAWLGQHLAAHHVPLRRGVCSFAVRWHGARPALLWDVPAGSTVRASNLDPAWSSSDPVGEMLLAEPSPTLLAMGNAAELAGTVVDAPDQFT